MRVADVRRAVGARARGVSRARPARAQAGALRPEEPRPLGPREHRVLPLHLADPAVPGPRRPPCAAARARARRRPAAGRPGRARRAHVRARAGGARRSSTSPTRSASRGCSSAGCYETRLGRAVAGRDHRSDRLGALRAVRRGVRGLPAGAPAARRVLRAERRSRPRSAGRTTGRPYRLGDPIEVRVESIARSEGKVELSLASVARL